jgi:hypothetical protein
MRRIAGIGILGGIGSLITLTFIITYGFVPAMVIIGLALLITAGAVIGAKTQK